jgi:hypothetical protein
MIMAVNPEKYKEIIAELDGVAQLVAVSKTKPVEDIRALYDLGQRDFGENYVQELVEKQAKLPSDIRWHFIGHLQTNKVKNIVSFVTLIHGVDSLKLLKEIDKQAASTGKVCDVLLQVYIAREETKFGMDAKELEEVITSLKGGGLKNVEVRGLMGMASFSNNPGRVLEEFRGLKTLFDRYFPTGILSMGMSGDYKIALSAGSTLIRVGSLLFGKRG